MKNFNIGKIRSGVVYKGRFMEIGSDEYKLLMFTDGRKDDNKDTLLGLISDIHIEENDLFDKN